jgi:hypothetical protein
VRALVLILLCACSASKSYGPSPKQIEYLKAHPLGPDEERRLREREARRGDTIDRVRVTFDDCWWEKAKVDGTLTIWKVTVPVDVRTIRVDTDRLEEVPPNGSVLLTFDRDVLKSAIIL